MLVLVVGLLFWSGYLTYQAYSQKTALVNELAAAQPTISAAKNMQTKLYAVAQDLIQTSAKDSAAAQIVKEANIQIKPGSNTTSDNSSAPAK